jgi:predicted permease
MNHIILAFRVVFPLMFMMSVGYLLNRIRLTDDHSLNVMNKLIFRVFLPLLLFLNIYSLKPEDAFNHENIRLLIYAAICVISTILILHLIVSALVKDKKKGSVIIQGIFRSNLILFGIAIASSIYGPNHIGKVSLLAAFIVPLYNILAVILLEYYRGGKVNYKQLIINILKNPLIIAAIFAFLLLILRIELPDFLLVPISDMSKISTPLAFIVLGATFRFSRLAGNMKYLIAVVLGKLIVMPAFVLLFAILFNFQGEALLALLGAFASPTAVSSFTMAKEMDADGELAGQIVVFTSIISILTIFIWIILLKYINFI